MKVVVYSSREYDRTTLGAASAGGSVEFSFYNHQLTRHTVSSADGFDGVCLFVNDHADRDVIESLAALGVKVIALRCSGFNNVDMEAAHEFGIKIYRVPAYSPESVAEYSVALIMTLNRKTHRAYNRVREGNFDLSGLLGFDLKEKTVGVVGTGMIGKAFCRIMRGFGCHVVAYDPCQDDEFASDHRVKYLQLDDLLECSDIVSLHCPLNEKTRHMINKESLGRFKRGAMLINTGRGALIDTTAVIGSLKNGKLGNLGIDVYEDEAELFFEDRSSEIIQDDEIVRLISFPNVLVTGHQGFFTREALSQIAEVTVENLTRFSNHIPPILGCEVMSSQNS
ncbi:MAG: D-lactate dehydrogenase [Cryomorphaceae bacterium]|jgi:D-lactate dehydrogenase